MELPPRKVAQRPEIDRPIVESLPIAAVEVFGRQLAVAQQFVSDLATYGEPLGLVGPREYPKLWTRHMLNCAVVADDLSGTVADVGSGAGFPGLVFAMLRPDLPFILIEPMTRRATWLSDETERLGLHNVDVWNERAEDCVGRVPINTVTARAVAALRKLLLWSAPLVVNGGRFVFLKGQSAQDEIDAARKELRKFHVDNVRIRHVGVGLLDTPTTVVDGVVQA